MAFTQLDEVLLESDLRSSSKVCLQPIKGVYFFLQSALILIGFFLTYFAADLRATFTAPDSPPKLIQDLNMAAIVCGTIIMFYGIFGMTTVLLKNRPLAQVYIFLVILAIFILIYAIYWVQLQLIYIDTNVSWLWDAIGLATRARLQSLVPCCGFRRASDRAALPCPKASIGPCFPAGRPSPLIELIRGGMLISLMCVFSLGFVLAILNIFILFVHEPRRRKYSFFNK